MSEDIVGYTHSVDPSESIVDTQRRLNVVLTTFSFRTKNVLGMGGISIPYYALNHYFQTIPIYVDVEPHPFAADSANIGGKMFDICKSGERGAYCLNVHDASQDKLPVRFTKIDGILLPANNDGNIIFAWPVPTEIEKETIVFFLGRPMRFVLCDGEWRMVISK